mmetsp:Transcript_56138/g.111437  ORF Transcript_56138/g.111437 Transcript_56138/m.111437 type:complete len:232 (-) Transcript_56138:914-1609(-)
MLKGRRQRHPPARLQFSHGGSPSSHAACARAWHAFVNLLRNARQTCATTAVRACAHGLGPWANGAKQSPPRKLSAALSPSPSVEPISVDPVSALRSALSASTYPNRERRADQTASRVIARSSMSASTPAAVVPVPAPAPRSTNGVCEYQPVWISTRLSEPLSVPRGDDAGTSMRPTAKEPAEPSFGGRTEAAYRSTLPSATAAAILAAKESSSDGSADMKSGTERPASSDG